MIIKSLPQYYVDPDNYDDDQIFSFASKVWQYECLPE